MHTLTKHNVPGQSVLSSIP